MDPNPVLEKLTVEKGSKRVSNYVLMEIGKALLGEVITKDCQDEKNQDVQSIANLRKSPTCPALRAGLFSQACGFSVLRVWSRKS